VLHTFEAGSDGAYPVATPVFDAAGRLYNASQQISGGSAFGAVLKGPEVLHDFVRSAQWSVPEFPHGGFIRATFLERLRGAVLSLAALTPVPVAAWSVFEIMR